MPKSVFVVSASSNDGGVPGSTFHVAPAVFWSLDGAIQHVGEQGAVTNKITNEAVPLGIFTVLAANLAGGEPYVENYAIREIVVQP